MRKPRLTRQGATYHVTAKSNRGEFIFESDEVKESGVSFNGSTRSITSPAILYKQE